VQYICTRFGSKACSLNNREKQREIKFSLCVASVGIHSTFATPNETPLERYCKPANEPVF
jgi:hypothetical protein